MTVFWGSQALGVVSNPDTTIWQYKEFDVLASSDATTILFRDISDKHWQLMDDVRVVAIPEPSGTLLLLAYPICLVYRTCRTRAAEN